LGTQLAKNQSRGRWEKSIIASLYRLHSLGKNSKSRLKHQSRLTTRTGRNHPSPKRVGIIGGSSPEIGHLKIAEELGKLIAQNGYILVNGGLKGVMEASARGAKTQGGLVIGILPGKSIQDANPYTDIAIPTGLGYLRNSLVVLNSDVLVAIDGEYGTLSEIAYTQIYGKKVFGIETWDIRGVIAVANPQAAIHHIQEYFDNLT
jgi:uncharacterized protein (TIGR00725 family)